MMPSRLSINLWFFAAGLTLCVGACAPNTEKMVSVPTDTPSISSANSPNEQPQDPYGFVRSQLASIDGSIAESTLPLIVEEREKVERFTQKYSHFIETIFNEMLSRRVSTNRPIEFSKNDYTFIEQIIEGDTHKTYLFKPVDGGMPARLLFDTKTLKTANPEHSVMAYAMSPDHNLVAVIDDLNGNERGQLRLVNIETQTALPIVVENIGRYFAWAPDSKSVFIAKKDDNGREYQLAEIFIDSGKEIVHFEEKDVEFLFGFLPSSDGSGLNIASLNYNATEIRHMDLTTPAREMVQYTRRTDGNGLAQFDFTGNGMFIASKRDDGRYEIVKANPIDSNKPNQSLYVSPENVSFDVFLVLPDHFVIEESHQFTDRLNVINRHTGEQHYVTMPDEDFNIRMMDSHIDLQSDVVRFVYTSFRSPALNYSYTIGSRELKALDKLNVPGYDPDNYLISRIYAPARDGAKIPVSLIQRKDIQYTPDSPLTMYTYGTYGTGITPQFSTYELSAIDRGYTYAIAHVRGGNELGPNWHEGGRLFNRHNSINDFVDVARHLVAEGYTSAGKIVARSESGGGQIIGMALNQAPELFHRVGLLVPFVDVLNTLLDDTLEYTYSDWSEFGNPAKDKITYNYIKSLSPYEMVKAQAYPDIYATAAFNDPAVGAWEPIKWVHRIRDNQTNNSVTLLDIRDGGHYSSKPNATVWDLAKLMAFLIHTETDANQ